MKKLSFIILLLCFTNLNSYANQAGWNMVFAVTDPEESLEFCEEILGMHQVKVPANSLPKYRAKFRDSLLQLHFVKLINDDQEYLLHLKELTLVSSFQNEHAIVVVNNLDHYLEKFIENEVPFLSPFQKYDGMYQIYFEIPGRAYLELNAALKPSLVEITSWEDATKRG